MQNALPTSNINTLAVNDIFHTVADAAGIVWQPTKQYDPGFLKQMHKGIIKTKYFTIMSRKDFVDAGGKNYFLLINLIYLESQTIDLLSSMGTTECECTVICKSSFFKISFII